MINTNSLNILGQFYFNLKENLKKIYQNSNFYEKKISKTSDKNFEYKPSPHLLSSIIKYQKKKYRIEDFAVESIWLNKMNPEDYEKLNNFFWFFSLDLKSSKQSTQSIILNWIESNHNYNYKSWNIDILSKRVIAWISNSKLTYEDSNQKYKAKCNHKVAECN